ncbi:MAG: ATP-binding cassette domain-containing protein [Gemmatimonadales bacterium]
MIELKQIHKAFGDNIVLDGVDLTIGIGQTVVLLGPSGVGKSVLLKHINGLLHPDAGEVWVDGLCISELDRKALSRLRSRIGYVFQFGALFDSEDVFENIRLGITDEDRFQDLDFCQSRIRECLQLVNLPPETAGTYPADLSGGMKKRVGIARAIAGSPSYLLYDEPTSGLDPVNADIIDALVEKLREELNVTSIVVSHDVRGSFRVADKLALLKNGKIVATGTPDELKDSDNLDVREFLERDFGRSTMTEQ